VTCSSSSPCASWQNTGTGTGIQTAAVGDGRGITPGATKRGIYGESDSASGGNGVHGTKSAANGVAVFELRRARNAGRTRDAQLRLSDPRLGRRTRRRTDEAGHAGRRRQGVPDGGLAGCRQRRLRTSAVTAQAQAPRLKLPETATSGREGAASTSARAFRGAAGYRLRCGLRRPVHLPPTDRW
jgi:hypothetical protein